MTGGTLGGGAALALVPDTRDDSMADDRSKLVDRFTAIPGAGGGPPSGDPAASGISRSGASLGGLDGRFGGVSAIGATMVALDAPGGAAAR